MSAYVALRSDMVTVTCAPAVECRLGVVRAGCVGVRSASDCGQERRERSVALCAEVRFRHQVTSVCVDEKNAVIETGSVSSHQGS
jgi:hypothetical protein